MPDSSLSDDPHLARKAVSLGALDYATAPVEVAHLLRASRRAQARPARVLQAG